MKSFFLLLVLAFSTSYSVAAEVTFSPSEQAPALTEQIRVQFAESIKKVENAFEVVCTPAVQGQGRWADNNTTWVYDISYGKDEYGDSLGLPGGANCSVTQKAALESASGKKWNKGSLQHSFSVVGPNVVRVYNLPGFNDLLREENPVFMVVFDGDVKKETLYANAGSFLWYSMKNDYPAGKILLSPVPANVEMDLFKVFADSYYLTEFNVNKDSKNWALVTINQNLIPGANINLSLTNIKSAYSEKTTSVEANIELKVREQFSAQVECDRMDDKSSCMPEGSVRVNFNAKVPWTMAQKVQLQYIPQNSTDGKMVTATPDESGVISDWLSGSMYQLYENFVSLVSISKDKAVIEGLSFNVKIKPNTQARVIFPTNLSDVDNRQLNQSPYSLNFGSYGEVIGFAKTLSVMEKNVIGNNIFPISVMNLKQKVKMIKSGAQAGSWTSVNSMPQVIDILVALEKWEQNFWDEEAADFDLFAAAGLTSNTEEIFLNGEKNKKTSLSLPFGKNKSGQISGVYALGVKSELQKKTEYGVVVVTDLNVQLKIGAKNVVAWVTSYSTGLPVSQAQVEIYGCDKQVVVSGQADQNGLFKFNKEPLPSCESDSYLLSGKTFFAVAKVGEDFAFTSSNYTANNSYAMGSPGVDYFYSDIQDESVLIKTVVGVNLVKPGQTVPVQLFATVPNQKGFKAANPAALPSEAQITNSDDSNIQFTFPLEWKNGVAEIQWDVPKAVTLGLYQIQVQMKDQSWPRTLDADIEVGEFKVPVMSAMVSLPQGPLAKADDISLSGLIQYANGVGAKDQTVEVSYYFADAVISSEIYEGFEFAKGVYTGSEQKQVDVVGLPTNEQAAKIENLKTDKQGTVKVDLSSQTVPTGETISALIQKATRPYQLIARMRYLDQMGEFQTVSTSQKIYNTTAYLGTKVTSGTTASAKLNVVNMGIDGKTLAANTDVKLEVLEVKTNVISEEVFGGFVKNIFENELKKTKWSANCSNKQGVMVCAVGSMAEGNYVFQATSKLTGQSTYSRFTIDAEGIVNGESDYYYFNKEDRSLLLGADKETYKGGDVAKLSFEKPFANCSALVTLERSDVVEAYVDSSACVNGYVKVPVASEQAPNVFTSVYLAAGRVNRSLSKEDFDLGKPSYRVGYSNLKIDWERYSLDVKVKTDKTEYKPKDMATVEVQITPEQGLLLGGEVTLVVIEEKILELRENKTYDLLSGLMGLREHTVSLANSYNFLTSVAQVQAIEAAAEPVSAAAKGGEEGGSGSEFESMDRKLFNALVSWQTKVPVVNGKAMTQFQVNDKLTKFKVFAIVSDASNKFGTGEATYVSAQELQTFANIPSVARTGDQFPVSVTLQNNGKAAGEFSAVVDYKIYDVNGNVIQKGTLKKTALLDSGSSQVVQVDTLTVPGLSSKAVYDITIYNQNGLVVDKLANEVQEIQPAIPVTVQEQYLVQMEKADLELVLKKDSEAVVGLGQIETNVFASLVGSASESVKNSLSGSPFATFTVENQILSALINSSAKDTKALDNVFAELISQVDSQGMIKYYPGAARGSYWMTVEVVQLIAAQDWALKRVPASLVNQWKKAFESVIAGQIEPAYISESSDLMIFLAASVKAANALVLMGGKAAVPQAADLIAQMEAQKNLNNVYEETIIDTALLAAQVQPEGMATSKVMKYINTSLLSVKDTSALIKSKARIGWWGYADEIISTAKMIKALSMAAQSKGVKSSSANFVDNLVKGLVNSNAEQKWYTVRTKAWALNGLSSFAKVFESQSVTGTTQIATSESSIVANVLWNSSVKENGVTTNWSDDSATVKLSHAGQGRPWVSVTAKAAVPVKGAKSQGFTVTKTILNMTRQDGTFAPGDMIQVDVVIESATSMSNVAMMDPIPAGANILSEGWGSYSMAQKSYEGYKVYFEYLSEGETKISYQYQLNNPGVFQIPPTRVEALYEPSLFGAVENKTITVK